MKRFWKSSGVFTPMKAMRSKPLRMALGNQGAIPFITALKWRSASRSLNACRISCAS